MKRALRNLEEQRAKSKRRRRERFEKQRRSKETALDKLTEMGFDRAEALQALRDARGNVEKAADLMVIGYQVPLKTFTEKGYSRAEALYAISSGYQWVGEVLVTTQPM